MSQDQGEEPAVETAEPENIDDTSPGERLKQARLSLGLSVADVSNRLKLSKDKIESLECGDVSDIAVPVFVAGYLRAYARLLELPEEAVLSDFSALPEMQSSADEAATENAVLDGMAARPDDEIFTKLPPSGGTSENSYSLLIAIGLSVLVVAAVYVAILDDESNDNTQTASAVSSEPENSAPELDADSAVADPVEAAVIAPDAKSSSVDDAPVGIETPVSATVNATDSAKDVGQGEAEQSSSAEEVFLQSELTLVFNEDSWVEVTDARGERLIYRLAKAGMSHTVTGVAPFDVQLGYVPGVEIFYGGAPHDLSRYAGRRSARIRVGSAGDHTSNQKLTD
jgi:cytoskeleton protein RodZ